MSVCAVILAAGGASRFNAQNPGAVPGSKLLAAVRGRPLLSWAIHPALDAQLDEVVVVGGAIDLTVAVPDTVTLLRNEDWQLGQASSLHVGIEWCIAQGHDRAVIGLGDMPGISSESWRRVARAPQGPIVFGTYARKRGHPVRLDEQIWAMLPVEGDTGARLVARRYPELVCEVACEGVAIDIDTREDLERWR